jgi:hypothetical protein
MSRAALTRRLTALEAGPLSLKTMEGWAAVYGWHQLYEWNRLEGRRVLAKLSPLFEEHGIPLAEPVEPVPDETELERQYHKAKHAQFPDPDAKERLREKLGLSRYPQ